MDINLDLRPLLAQGDAKVLQELVRLFARHGADLTTDGVPVLPLLLDAQCFTDLNAIGQVRPPGFYTRLRAAGSHVEQHRIWRRLAVLADGEEALYEYLIPWQELTMVLDADLDCRTLIQPWQFTPDRPTPGAKGLPQAAPWDFPDLPVARSLALRMQPGTPRALADLRDDALARIAVQVSYQGYLPETSITPASRDCVRIPEETGHRFQVKVDTDSRANWTPQRARGGARDNRGTLAACRT